jgi:NAD(P)-dependent dehydrogenase (short-subunit alcohol dehydrogenase family)
VHTELFEQTHGARAKLKGISLEQQKAEMEQDNPMQRLVETHEIADAVAYLVGDGAAAVNGHLLTVDGGRSIA